MSETPKQGWFSRLKSGLSRSSTALKDRITGIVAKKRLDEATLEELEEALIMADLGVETSAEVVRLIAKDRFGKEVGDVEIREALAQAVAGMLAGAVEALPHRAEHRPQVVLVCGVNGTGKTTTIGKLAKQASEAGLSVMLAACDTFRAAAVEQLEVWGQRNNVPVIRGKEGTDPAGLAYEALARARAAGTDLLLIDTAGRLHNKAELMEELRKIIRVIKKLDMSAPHDTLLVLDATTGQNAHSQVEIFTDMVDVSGLVVTKLDGTARGGVVVALARRFGLPIHAVGVGEGIDDLRPFEALAFARALLGLDNKDAA
ncbi:signal recognition particle-docking protein FtsY [Geminicoccaceae bacterium 1502E]|nr:signal recognition particle-docking protein FtsY [Geminicoccaceae bacterium 1502E]